MAARYIEIAQQVYREIQSRREQQKSTKFHCTRCEAHFDTSVGFAKHQAYGCDHVSAPAAEKTLPSCAKCGSYALYRDGSCMTCAGEF